MGHRDWNDYIKAEIGLLIIIIVSPIILNHSLLSTIPIAIIVAFFMCWMEIKPRTIYITFFIMHIILGIDQDNLGYSLFLLPSTIIEITGGVVFAKYLKRFLDNKKDRKTIIMIIIGGTLIITGINSHRDLLGNPFEYLRAKKNIEKYIDETYEGKLRIEKIRYSWKMNFYIADVENIKDSRNKGSMLWYVKSGRISDDYHFRIKEKQSNQAKEILLAMVKQKTDIPVADIDLDVFLKLPYNKYTPKDMYLGEEPIYVHIELEPDSVEDRYEYKEKHGKLPEDHSYNNIEEFSKEAYKILKVLKDINYPYEEINIMSFLSDGNRSYNITINGEIKVAKIEDVIKLVGIEGSNKKQ